MKQDTLSNNVEVEEIGSSFKHKKAKISEKNIPYIFSILANFYSKPKESIVREITSNCNDAHVDAGKPNEIIIVRLYVDESGQHFIEFVDQGTGISEDSMDEVFMSYGESTRRDSDDFIGCFGLGSKSPFSESDYFYVITKINGVESTYLLNSTHLSEPTYDCLLQTEIDVLSTGTIIRVPIKSNEINIWEKAIQKQLRYFKNVYVVNFSNFNNDYVIHKYDAFQIREDFFLSNKNSQLHLVLGDVYYPIRFDELDVPNINFNAALNFKIGSLDITPNREELKYTDKTKKAIIEQIDLFKKELLTYITDDVNFQCTHLIDYRTKCLDLKNNRRIFVKNLIPNQEFYLGEKDCNIKLDESIKYKIFIHDDFYSPDYNKFNPDSFCKILFTTSVKYRYRNKLTKYNERIHKTKANIEYLPASDFKYLIVPKNKHTLKINEKLYIASHCKISRVIHFENDNFFEHVTENFLSNNNIDPKNTEIIDVFINKYKEEIFNVNFLHIDSLNIPLDYGKVARSRTSIKKENDTILYYEYNRGTFSRQEEKNEFFKNNKSIFIYGDKEDSEDLINLRQLFYDIKVFRTGKKYQKILKDLPNCFSIKEICEKKEKHPFFNNNMQFINGYFEYKILQEERNKQNFIFQLKDLDVRSLRTYSKTRELKKLAIIINFFKKNFNLFDSSTSYFNNDHLIKKFFNQPFIDKLFNKLKIKLHKKYKIFEVFNTFCKDFYLELNHMMEDNIDHNNISHDDIMIILNDSLNYKKITLNKYYQTIEK